MTFPSCPHCSCTFDQECLWHFGNGCDFPTESDGDEGEFNCPGCGERLYVTLILTPSWEFKDEDGEELRPQAEGGA
jgi:hypothetical protein